MTTTEALRQVIRNTSISELSNVTGDEADCLVRALNEGIQDYFDLAPDLHKRTTFSHYVQPPGTVSNIYLTKGNTVTSSGTPFTVYQRGCSIILEGDPNHNEVVDTNAVLKPYLGDTAAPLTGSIYYDAIPLTDFSIERVVSHPRITTTTTEERVLSRAKPESGHHVNGTHGDVWWRSLAATDGYPKYYRVDYVGGSIQNENDALIILRMAPKPTVGMTVTFEADVRPTAYGVTAIHDAREIPVSRTMANHLLPLIEARLIETPLWRGSEIATKLVLAREERARERCQNMPSDFARPTNKAGTNYGW